MYIAEVLNLKMEIDLYYNPKIKSYRKIYLTEIYIKNCTKGVQYNLDYPYVMGESMNR